ncbi:MAG: glycosyltransferase family A protein [Bacteroidota bacterium]|nr:glycosyltransferase family A protein [Bacteroidota bacterium]
MENNNYKISLVICTYNRAAYLPEALESIKEQTFDTSAFQVIIVDNFSTDNTALISANFIKDNPAINCKYCFEKNKGLSFARNRGIDEAEALVIAYVDDDAILSPRFLEEMTIFFNNHPDAVGAGGKVIPKYEKGNEPEWMSQYLNGFVGKVDHGNDILLFKESMKYPAGCNMAYKKDILKEAGGFNNELKFRSDDKYIFYKVKAISDKIYYVPGVWLYHYIDSNRLQIQNFKKLFLKTGNEEKKRLISEKSGVSVLFKKLVEFIFKAGASLVLFLLFLLKGQYAKGKYIVIAQWCTLTGFLKKDVFVR